MNRNYRDLIVWRKAIELVEVVYRISGRWPDAERYGLTSQARRSAVSVPSNIAEGEGRGGDKDFCRFLQITHGSLRELETQLLIAHRLHFVNDADHDDFIGRAEEVGRLLNGLMRHLRS